jgi:serine/threonine protein kinase/DNA-directed RNA polymerase subunit RPC12/RpoP
MDLSNTTFGQYRIMRLLGRGGMGEVYEAEHTTLARRYALKLLPRDFASRPEALARFRREARVMANLEHPYIVRVDDFAETEGRYWLRMELVKGIEPRDRSLRSVSARQRTNQAIRVSVKDRCVTLSDFAARRGERISQDEFAVILKQILEALAYAHELGVIHRDLKPGNILLENDAVGGIRVKVSDFGLARVIGEEFIRSQARTSAARSMSLRQAKTQSGELSLGDEETIRNEEGTSTRALLGTWEYMSPEQQRGEDADARSDIYAVGLMCYRLLTGGELGMKKPSHLVAGLESEWDSFIKRALEQEAGNRYLGGAQMLEAFSVVNQAVEKSRKIHQLAEKQRRWEEMESAAARGKESGRKGRLLSTGADIRFACPHCDQHLICERDFEGRGIDCPTCNQTIIIPAGQSAPAWRIRLTWAVGISVLLAALWLAGSWWFKLSAVRNAGGAAKISNASTNQPAEK